MTDQETAEQTETKPRGGARQGAGRPRLIENPVRVHVMLPAWMVAEIDKVSNTRSELVRDAISERLAYIQAMRQDPED